MTERIEVRVTPEMYSALLHEADGNPKEIPEVIRTKIKASWLSRDDAKAIRAQQNLLLSLLKELVLDNVPTVVRMKSILNDYEGDDLVRERAATETAFVEKLERIDRMKREAGL